MLLTGAVVSARSAHNATSSLVIADTLLGDGLDVMLARHAHVLSEYLLNHQIVPPRPYTWEQVHGGYHETRATLLDYHPSRIRARPRRRG